MSLAPLALWLALFAHPILNFRVQLKAKSNAKFQATKGRPIKNTTALIYLHQTGKDPDQWPDYAKMGKCCTKTGRDGKDIIRWFYHIVEPKAGTSRVSDVWLCPSKWSGTSDYNCNGKEAYNKVGYQEDTDWVMCCKKGETVKYPYFEG